VKSSFITDLRPFLTFSYVSFGKYLLGMKMVAQQNYHESQGSPSNFFIAHGLCRP
jgi:hypothetical protein